MKPLVPLLRECAADDDDCAPQTTVRAIAMRAAANEIERLRAVEARYETARRMHPRQWTEAWALSLSTGKPFDEIIDDMRPFMFPAGPDGFRPFVINERGDFLRYATQDEIDNKAARVWTWVSGPDGKLVKLEK